MIASTKAIKPYTITSGTPYFNNAGDLFMGTVGDQVVIEWPHSIKGLTGFSKILPHIYSTDFGLNQISSLGVLVEYDLDKGSGYSDTWETLNSHSGLNNLVDETGISANGVRPKFRLTARQGLKYTSQSSQFVIGETIQNATSNPSATAVVVADESVTSTTGTLIVSNVTGEWLTTNTIYSTAGTTRATITATNANVFFPQPTSKITAFRLFTDVDLDTAYNYAFTTATLKLTGLVAGSEVRVFKTSDMSEVAGIEANPTSTFQIDYDYYNDTNVYIVVIKDNYIPIRLENQVLSSSGLTIPIQQQFDRQYQE
jgi:hypothetical protein